MELLNIKEVMELLHVGRYTATRIIKRSGLAVNKKKGQKLLIEKTALMEYLKDGAL